MFEKRKKKSTLGDPRSWRKRIAAVSNPNGLAVREAQEGILNATIRQTGTERQCSFYQTSLPDPWAASNPPRLLSLACERQNLAKLTLLRMHTPACHPSLNVTPKSPSFL